jgi:hypothetical protein
MRVVGLIQPKVVKEEKEIKEIKKPVIEEKEIKEIKKVK